MRIDQVLVGAAPGDAITESAMLLRNALRHGVGSDVFALHLDSRLKGEVRRLEEFPERGSRSDVIVFHVSIGDQRAVDFVLRRPERLVLNYHNITPASYFQSIAPAFASLLRTGRGYIAPLLRRAEGAIADSEYNAAELRALSPKPVIVAPPALHLRRLASIEPDAGVLEELRSFDAPVILCVGQLLPHKRPELAVQALHYLNVNHDARARLVLAGPPRNHLYTDALRRHVESLNLPTVWLTGEVTDAQLAAFFRGCDLLLVPSEHEGFCVPIVEAFVMGLPVVTRRFGAIPQTAGDAALVLPRSSGAVEMAEAMAAVLRGPAIAAELRRRGVERSREFSTAATVKGLLEGLRTLLAPAPAA